MLHLFLNLKLGQGLEGKTLEWGADNAPGQRPAIHVHINSTRPPGIQPYTQGYALRLDFGMVKDGNLPGRIYLCLPDERKSWIAGSLTLEMK